MVIHAAFKTPKAPQAHASSAEAAPAFCGLCGHKRHREITRFTAPPAGETDFGFPDYARTLWRCDGCGHLVNRHGMDLKGFYDGQYSQATYGDRMRSTFERIMTLPDGRSDNRERVAWIEAHLTAADLPCPGTLLDVGAGLGVFPAAMEAHGWLSVALDPDPVVCAHLESVLAGEVWCGSFEPDAPAILPHRRFSLVTFNKVLEHIEPMVETLARAHRFLAPGGRVYVELPDGEGALADAGPDREEFFIEHHCAFSLPSYTLLARKAGYRVEAVERVREPSGKFTLRGCLSPDL